MIRTVAVVALLLALTAGAFADGAPVPLTFDQFVSVWYRLWDATKAAGIDPAAIVLKTYVDRQPFDQKREHDLKLTTRGVQWRVFKVTGTVTWGKTVAVWRGVLGKPRILLGNGAPTGDEAVWYFPPPLHLGISLMGEMRDDQEGRDILKRLIAGKSAFAPEGEAAVDVQIP